MADATLLLIGLEEYHTSLARHMIELRTDFEELQNQWYAFSQVYEGQAAEEFRMYWQRTAERFREYEERTFAISRVLEERIAALRAVDTTSTANLG